MLILTHDKVEYLVGKSGRLFTRFSDAGKQYSGYIVGAINKSGKDYFIVHSLINISRIGQKNDRKNETPHKHINRRNGNTIKGFPRNVSDSWGVSNPYE